MVAVTLIQPVGEVLASDAEAGVFASLQLMLVDKISFLHTDLA